MSEAACIWMQISPSARASAMGNTFSPLSADPFNAWLAPGSEALAPLASWAEVEAVAYPSHVEWLPPSNHGANDIFLANQALTLRTDLNEASRRAGLSWRSATPWHLSLSYLRILLDEGEQTITDEQGNVLGTSYPLEKSHSLRMGLGRQGERWSLGLGLGVDQVISELGSAVNVNGLPAKTGRSTTFDAGVNVQASLPRQPLDAADPQAGFVEWSAGLHYAKLFLGKRMSYSDVADPDPMPFHDRLALACRWRAALPASGRLPELPVLEAQVALERSVDLVDSHSHLTVNGIRDSESGGHWEDANDPVDDLKVDRHYLAFDERLLAGGSAAVTRSWGWEMGVLGSFFVRGGALLDRDGSIDEITEGRGLGSAGLANWALRNQPSMSQGLPGQILRRLDFRYQVARLHSDSPRNGTVYREVALRWVL